MYAVSEHAYTKSPVTTRKNDYRTRNANANAGVAAATMPGHHAPLLNAAMQRRNDS